MNPLLKWAGGKRTLAEAIVERMGLPDGNYIEPFLGGAALLLHIAPHRAICSDINKELINFYSVVRDKVEELIEELRLNFAPNNSEEFFYQVRGLDRDKDIFMNLSDVQRAARFIYLNKTCFNGLWRENLKGCNNVPWGKHKELNLPTREHFLEVHNYLASNDIQLLNADYKTTARLSVAGDLVYFDPPYDDEKQVGFVSYSSGGFTRQNQTELRDLCSELIDRGVRVAVSNADTTFIRELYAGDHFTIYDDLVATRSIGARARDREKVNELLIVGR